jgi:hypothetical protein
MMMGEESAQFEIRTDTIISREPACQPPIAGGVKIQLEIRPPCPDNELQYLPFF